jgi:SAM-dependent methyltransferase
MTTVELQDEVWSGLPEGGEPWERSLREGLLLARVRPGARVLDLGCGEGWACAALLATGARPVGVDVSAVALERAARHHPGIAFHAVVPGRRLPFGDGSFDVVWASEVLAHAARPGPLLSEARRTLRPGGLLLATTGHHGRLRGWLRRARPALRHDSRRSLRRELRDAGFSEVHVHGAGGLPLRRRLLVAEARA